MGHPRLRTGGAVSSRTATQEGYPFSYITIFDPQPAAMDRTLRMQKRKTMLGCDSGQIGDTLIQSYVISNERKHNMARR